MSEAAIPQRPASSANLRRVGACFLLSGAASLLFETLWARAFGLILGNSLQGISVVTGLFLAGLGIGAALASRFADRLKRPVLWYARVEALIGLWGLLGAFLLPRLPSLLSFVAPMEDPSGAAYFVLRPAAALLFLGPPTLLMGMTLPLLTGGLIRGGNFLRGFGTLYGLNTVGAFVGAAAGGFVILPRLGSLRATAVAAGFNFIIYFVARGLDTAPPAAAAPEAVAAEPPAARPAGKPRGKAGPARPPAAAAVPTAFYNYLLGPLCLLAGVISLACEITWTRGLALILGPSIYTFSLILSVFLLGGGAGSLLWAARRGRISDPLRLYGLLWVLLAVTITGSLVVLNQSGEIFLRVYSFTAVSKGAILAGLFLQAALTIILPALLFGLHFPLTGEIFRAAGAPPGFAAGRAYLWNSAGALIGSVLAGFVLLPWLGTATTLRAAAALALLLGTSLLALRLRAAAPVRGILALACAGLAVLFAARGPDLSKLLRDQGIYRVVSPHMARSQPAARFLGSTRSLFANRQQLFLKEGRLATVGVWYWEHNLSITVAGKADASYRDMPTQVLVGQLPMVLHPNPRDVFVVGYGSGVTASSVLSHHPDRVDMAEIEPAVVEGARSFRHLTGDVLGQPGAHLYIDDGRSLLTYGRRKYDVIVSEPTNPWIAGVNNLFTREFYHIARSRLKPGGIFSQWFPLYDLTSGSLHSMLRSLAREFPHFVLYEGAEGDLIVVASRERALDLGPRAWSRPMTPEARRWLQSVGIYTPLDAAVLLLNDESWSEGTGPLNLDDNGYVEFRAPWEQRAFQDTALSLNAGDLCTDRPLQLLRDRGWDVSSPAAVQTILGKALDRKRIPLARNLLADCRRSGMALSPAADSAVAQAVAQVRYGSKEVLLLDAAAGLERRNMHGAALQKLLQAYAINPNNPVTAMRLAYLYADGGHLEDARAVIGDQLRRGDWTLRYVALCVMADLDGRAGDTASALRFLDEALHFDPYREEAYLDKARALAGLGRRPEAVETLEEGAREVPWSANLAAAVREAAGGQ